MIRWYRTIMVVGTTLLSLSCRDLTGSRPAPSLTGTWSWFSGVDFFTYFNLQQEGPGVMGESVYMFGNGIIDTSAVTGRVNGREVQLQWRSQLGTEISQITLSGQLSQDGQTVTVTQSVNGGQPIAVAPLRRSGQPN
jgi:hypothetical protein